ncbi:MAG: DotU family type IV/VI secretion system protein [Planctomycetaceae bacterium]
MNSTFARAVDEVFLTSISLLSDLQQGGDWEAPALQRRLITAVDQAESLLRGSEWTSEWDLAKYALVAWLDEMLVDELEWPGSEWWSNNVLEVHYFRTRECSTRFFERSREVLERRALNAFEVYYDCVLLGFQGMYRNPLLAEQMAPALGLAPRLDSLVALAHRELQLSSRPLDIKARRPDLVPATPLVSERLTRWPITLAILLLILNLALPWIR